MTTTDLTKAQLATVLSALDERPRNPANRTEALKAIGKSAQRYGVSAEDILAAAPGLLDGRLSPGEFRAELQDHTGGGSEGGAAPDAQEPARAGQEPAGAGSGGRRRERTATKAAPADKPAPRVGTKQALLMSMLRRPDGATVEEVVEATGWQKHTVRGAISGALKKKLGLDVTSDKVEGRGRVYRITGPDAAV